MPFSEAEARMRRLEQRVTGAEHDVLVARERRGKISQDLTVIRSGFDQTCLSGFRGFVFGLQGTGLVNAHVRIVGHQTGVDYGTFIANDPESVGVGAYLAQFRASNADTTFDVYAEGSDGPGGRFDGTTPLLSGAGFTRCGIVTAGGATLKPVPASGYAAAGNVNTGSSNAACQYPLKQTLTLVDLVYGTVTLTWNSGTQKWEGCLSGIAYPGGSSVGCAAVTTAYTYKLWYRDVFDDWELDIFVPHTGVGGPTGNCPIAATCATSTSGLGTKIQTSWTCPDVTVPSGFAISFLTPQGPLGATDVLYPGRSAAATTINVFDP